MSARPFQLPRTFKAEVYKTVERLGLDPHDFTWTPFKDVADTGEELFHRPTTSYVRIQPFDGAKERFWASWHPPNRSGRRYGPIQDELNLTGFVEQWLQRVKLEHDTPDYWQAVASERELLGSEPPDGDQSFTDSERKLIGARLDQLEKEIARVSTVNAEGLNRLHTSFERVSAASAKLTRREWKTMFVGTLFEKILDLALDPQRVMHLANIYIGPIVARVQGLLS